MSYNLRELSNKTLIKMQNENRGRRFTYQEQKDFNTELNLEIKARKGSGEMREDAGKPKQQTQQYAFFKVPKSSFGKMKMPKF